MRHNLRMKEGEEGEGEQTDYFGRMIANVDINLHYYLDIYSSGCMLQFSKLAIELFESEF